VCMCNEHVVRFIFVSSKYCSLGQRKLFVSFLNFSTIGSNTGLHHCMYNGTPLWWLPVGPKFVIERWLCNRGANVGWNGWRNWSGLSGHGWTKFSLNCPSPFFHNMHDEHKRSRAVKLVELVGT